MSLFSGIEPPRTPGLFVTGTDTGVGKTVVSCLIADQLRRHSTDASPRSRIGVFKPIATGCRREREELFSDDAEQLAHAAEFDSDIGDLTTVCPARFRAPLAPAVALEQLGPDARLDVESIARALSRLDERCEAIVVEGIGGPMVPLAPMHANAGSRGPFATVLDLMAAIGYPVVVVCRAGLGTLSQTAMACRVVRDMGLSIAGLVVNGYDPESADESMQTNRFWLERQTRAPILATLPVFSDHAERATGERPGGTRSRGGEGASILGRSGD